MPVITIDGNIGAGKSSILDKLQKNHNQVVSFEPIADWEPYLEDIYKNNVGYFHFQLKVFLDRAFIQTKSNSIIYMERSPKFTRETFVSVYKDKFSPREYDILEHLYDNVDHKYNKSIIEPVIYIYIAASPTVCFNRIKERDRESETTIDFNLIQQLHNKHEECYDNINTKGLPCFKINSDDKTPDEIAELIVNYVQGNSI
jgi:deoxyadenosine/deoxycytidine kinase